MALQDESDKAQQVLSQAKIQAAFERFEEAIYPNDAKLFRSLELEDVWNAARAIESNQSARRSLRNTRRIQPLFEALKLLGNALEPLCQGVPYLCYIWAPIKLALVIFDRHITAYEKVMEAYSQIVQNLPRFDRLGNAFRDQPEFQGVLADVYTDILDFHLEVHKIARRGGWRRLFDSCWGDFSGRLSTILTNLATNRDLVDREAASFEILESKELRRKLKEDSEKNDKDRRDEYAREVFNWLDLAGRDREQEDLLNNFQETRVPGTCVWVMDHPKVRTWLDEEDPRGVLWLKGKPGAGKTTLAAYLVENAPISPRSFILYCICSELLRKGTPDVANVILRLLCAQILRSRHDLLAFVYEDYVRFNTTASMKRVRELLKLLLESLGTNFLILDGLDEYDMSAQEQIIEEFTRLLKPCLNHEDDEPPSNTKLLICSRETTSILRCVRKLSNLLVVNLTEEHHNISQDIAKFTKAKLPVLHGRFSETVIDEVGGVITEKADGMFLWVHLILGMVQSQWSVEDLKAAVNSLPKGLNGVYQAILDRLQDCPEIQAQNSRRILGLLAHAFRPLKYREVCDGIVFHKEHGILNEETKLEKGVLDICKPLIELRQHGHVSLVHFTARAYLQNIASGPYLSTSKVHSQITLACFRYLNSSRIFLFEPDYPKVAAQVIKGFHDFFPYAYEFWFEHLSSAVELVDDGAELREIIDATEKLWLLFRKQVPIHSDTPPIEEPESIPADASIVKTKLLSLLGPIREYILFKHDKPNIGQRICKLLDAERDPSMLSEAFLQYHSILESLIDGSLSEDIVVGLVSKHEIAEFMSRNRDVAYRCHWVGCARAWTGFCTPEERELHERSHKQQYRCKEPGCLLTFGSRQALRKHKRDYHTKESDWVLPKKRAAEPAEGDVNERPINLVEKIDLHYKFDSPWYRSPNLDMIRQNACKLAAETPKPELLGILERMPPRLKEQLSTDYIDPLQYHFRKSAIKEFRNLQEEETNKYAMLPAGSQRGIRPRLTTMIKNTVFIAHLEAEAGDDIDASLSNVLDVILTRPAQDPELAEGWGDDVSRLFRVRLSLHAEVNNTHRPRNRLLHSCTEDAEYFGRRLVKRDYFHKS